MAYAQRDHVASLATAYVHDANARMEAKQQEFVAAANQFKDRYHREADRFQQAAHDEQQVAVAKAVAALWPACGRTLRRVQAGSTMRVMPQIFLVAYAHAQCQRVMELSTCPTATEFPASNCG